MDLEKRLLDSALDKPLVWFRYIDDVFPIWTHGQSKLDSYLEYLNGFHKTMMGSRVLTGNIVVFLNTVA